MGQGTFESHCGDAFPRNTCVLDFLFIAKNINKMLRAAINYKRFFL